MKEEKKRISSEEKLFNDIEELEEKILELKDLGVVEIAESFQPIVDELKKKYKENNHISNDLKKDIYKVMDYLNFEIDLQYQFRGIIRETKLISERYNEKFEEFATDFEEKSTVELWKGIREFSEGFKIYSEENSRLKAQQFNKAIAKQVLSILNIKAKKGEEIDLPQAEELCSKEDLMNALKDMLIEISENAEKKEVFLDTAEFLDEKSLENPEVWQLLSGVQEVKFVERKKEIEISKPKGILPKYEGLGLEKLGFSVYTLGDINEEGEWVNVRKEYGRFPRDFGDENDRVLAVEINGEKYMSFYILKKYRNLQNIILNDIDFPFSELFEGINIKKVEFRKDIKYIPNCFFEECSIESVIIPDSVERIGNSAFYGCENLKKFEIGKGVKEIEGSSFSNSGLTSIIIPDNVVDVGTYAFADCKNLKRVLLGNSVKEIPLRCFIKSGLESIVIPDNVEKIGKEAFLNCKNLKTIVLGKGLKEIGGDCFKGCEDLTIIIPEGVTIHKFSLGDCNPKIITLNEEQMRIYKRRDEKIPETTFLKKSMKDDKDSDGSEKSCWENISDDIKELEEKVRKIYYLRQTTLANSYKARVDELRRKYTEVLNSEDIIFGSDMDSQILDELFALKKELNEYINGEGKEVENKQASERYTRKIGEITTSSDEKSTEALWTKVQKIAEQLKIDCERNPRLEAEQLDKLIAKQVLRILRIQAKRGEEIDLPKAEELCSKEDLVCAIKDKLNDIARHEESVEKKDELFEKSRYLEEESLKNPEIWKMLTGVQDVKLVGEKKEIEIKNPRSILDGFRYEGLGIEKLPWISVYTLGDIDEKTGEWINLEKKYGRFPRDFGDENCRVLQIEIKGVKDVEHWLCARYSSLQKVIFGDSVEKLGEHAFSENKKLKEVEFGKGLKEIRVYCFSGCELEEIYIPKNVEKIENGAFYQCKNLKSIRIGGGKKELYTCSYQRGYGSYIGGPFHETPAWENGNVIISDNTELNAGWSIFILGEIDHETGERKNVRRLPGLISDFQTYRNQVLEIEINDVSRITEDHQLKDYPNLERVLLGENVVSIYHKSFKDCKKLKSVEMSDSIQEIGQEAFRGSGIEMIEIPYRAIIIGKSAFADCKSLTKVELGAGINKIPSQCFARNPSLTDVTIQHNLKIEDDAFYDCPQTVFIQDPYAIGHMQVTKNGRKIQYIIIPRSRYAQGYERNLDDDENYETCI